jgi:hypothetical protein
MRERRLLQAEMALMPETQVEIQRREEEAERVRYINALCRDFRRVKVLLVSEKKLLKQEKAKKKDKTHTRELNERITQLSELARNIQTRIGEVFGAGDAKPPREKDEKQVLFNCPVDGCRGFVQENHKCCVCNIEVCKKCNIILKGEEQHECKKEDVETAQMLRRETKPCPECHAIIFKIDGCDQMWCTQCKTPFSWRTGQKVFERIHNPHYYEWQRQANGGVAPRVEGDGGGRPNDGMCGNRIDYRHVNCYLPYTKSGELIRDLHRFMGHILHMFIEPTRPNNLELRIEYIRNFIDKETFARNVQIRDKRYIKDLELRQIATLCEQLCEENIFRNIHGRKTKTIMSPEQTDELVKKMYEIINFTNQQFAVVAKKYKIKAKKLEYIVGPAYHWWTIITV